MIILAPTDETEKYFTSIAKDVWTNYNIRDPDVEYGMKKEFKTLSVSCDLDLGENTVAVKFHYRFLRNTLYCFVEEI